MAKLAEFAFHVAAPVMLGLALGLWMVGAV